MNITDYVRETEHHRNRLDDEYVLASRQNKHLHAAGIHAEMTVVDKQLNELRDIADNNPNATVTHSTEAIYDDARRAAYNTAAR